MKYLKYKLLIIKQNIFYLIICTHLMKLKFDESSFDSGDVEDFILINNSETNLGSELDLNVKETKSSLFFGF